MTSDAVLLAFDTSTAFGVVGVGRDGRLLASERLTDERAQAAGLVPRIGAVLEAAGVDRRALDGIVVGRGPGSFTGVRVAAATARGLAHGLGIPVWGVSSLAGAALSAGASGFETEPADPDVERVGPDGTRPRFVLFDARSDRVYAACYRVLEGRLETLLEPTATVLDEALESPPQDAVFCGDAALRHAERIRRAGHPVAGRPLGVPTVEGLLRAHAMTDQPPLAPGWEPEYLRDSSARVPVKAHGPA